MFPAFMAFLALPFDLPLVLTFFLLLDYNEVGVAHGEVEAGKLLCFFYRVNLNDISTLPWSSFCPVWQGALYADQCCSVGHLRRGGLVYGSSLSWLALCS